MSETTLNIPISDGVSVAAKRSEPEGDAGWTFLYAPGAGSNVHDPFGRYACRELASRGVLSLRFQFPYQEAGRRSPDRPAVLEATWRAVIEATRPATGRLVIGGRSMGGRIASQVVAAGTSADALALFAYPLHPPGKPEQTRDAHLPPIAIPTIFCSGTNDVFASPDELRAAAAKVAGSVVHLLRGADHGFNAPKSSGRIRQEIWAEALGAVRGWLTSV